MIPDFTSWIAGWSLFKAWSLSSVVGRVSKRISSRLMKTRIRQGTFAPRELPRFLATMSPSDSRSGRPAVIYSRWSLVRTQPEFRPPGRVSQVPRLICRRPPSCITPGSPAAVYARCFANGFRFHPSGRLTAPICCNEAAMGSLALRLTPSPSQASTAWLPITPPSRLHGERAIPMVSTFQLTRSTRLSLTHRIEHGLNTDGKAQITGRNRLHSRLNG